MKIMSIRRKRLFPSRQKNGFLTVSPEDNVCKIAVIERHRASGNKALGLVLNIGLNASAALATTVSHDCHNLMVIGNDDRLMAEAANRVAAMQGGISVVTEEKATELALPVAG